MQIARFLMRIMARDICIKVQMWQSKLARSINNVSLVLSLCIIISSLPIQCPLISKCIRKTFHKKFWSSSTFFYLRIFCMKFFRKIEESLPLSFRCKLLSVYLVTDCFFQQSSDARTIPWHKSGFFISLSLISYLQISLSSIYEFHGSMLRHYLSSNYLN